MLAALAVLLSCPVVASAAIVEVGDSIAAGYCLPAQRDQFAFLLGKRLHESVTDFGQEGFQVGTMIQRELPKVARNAYDTVIFVGGTNDNILLFAHPGYSSVSKKVADHITALNDLRMLEPNAKILDVGVRDLGYNDSRLSASQKLTFANQIADYNAAVQAWVAKQPGMAHLPIFPARPASFGTLSYPAYYESDMTCGPWHPSNKAEPLIESGLYQLWINL